MQKETNKGLIAILSANTIFGLNIPITKALVANWMSPMAYTTTRMVFGALVFWLISFFFKKEKVQPRDLLIILIGGIIGYMGTQFLFSQSLKFTSPVTFSLIMALTPVLVLILSAIFLKERIPSRKIVGIALSVSGAALIILLGAKGSSSRTNNSLGLFFAILCVLAYSVYLMITRSISVKYSPATIAKYMFLISALVVFPISFNTLDSQKIYTSAINLNAILLMGFALLFSTTIAFFLMPYALKRLEASTVSVFMNVQPIVASIVAIFVGQDVLTWEKPFSVLLVVAGVYLVTSQKRNSKKQRTERSILKWKTKKAS